MREKYDFVEKTQLTLHHYLKEVTFDPGHNDVTTDDLLEAFINLMQVVGYDRGGIIDSMREFIAEEDEYNENRSKKWKS